MAEFESPGGGFEKLAIGLLGIAVFVAYGFGVGHLFAPAPGPHAAVPVGVVAVSPLSPPPARIARSGVSTPRAPASAAMTDRVAADATAERRAPRHVSLFGGDAPDKDLSRIKSVGVSIEVASATDLDEKFAELDYWLNDIRRGAASVPRLRLVSLPPDLGHAVSAKDRKRLFIKAILPLVLQVNEDILADRRKLVELVARPAGTWDPGEREWLGALAERYGVVPDDVETLVRRVDIVPPSLALAQAAEESGWGTSRFAREANAVFGQRTFVPGTGIVPARRDADKSHEVKTFDRLRHSVASYVRNLNSHWAYADFRLRRQELRSSGEPLAGSVLADTLHSYSERGAAYVRTIRTIMRVNGLGVFDRSTLYQVADKERGA
jgi:Bax protein